MFYEHLLSENFDFCFLIHVFWVWCSNLEWLATSYNRSILLLKGGTDGFKKPGPVTVAPVIVTDGYKKPSVPGWKISFYRNTSSFISLFSIKNFVLYETKFCRMSSDRPKSSWNEKIYLFNNISYISSVDMPQQAEVARSFWWTTVVESSFDAFATIWKIE